MGRWGYYNKDEDMLRIKLESMKLALTRDQRKELIQLINSDPPQTGNETARRSNPTRPRATMSTNSTLRPRTALEQREQARAKVSTFRAKHTKDFDDLMMKWKVDDVLESYKA